MFTVDLTIENAAAVVTMNDEREVLKGCSVAISGDKIVALGPPEEIRRDYAPRKTIDASGKVVLPGLINAHTHLAMTLMRGLKLAVKESLYRVIWPIEKTLTGRDCYIGALLGAAEAVKAGSTCVVDHYFFMQDIARATTEVGIRGVLGHTIMSWKGPFTGREEFEKGVDFVRSGKSELVIPWLAPHAPDTVSTEWLLELKELAGELGVGLHLHLAQSLAEVEYVRGRHGKGSVEYLHDIGFLGPDVLAVHCVYISDEEMDILAASGTNVVYCPAVHALSGHPARAWEMIQRGANVLLGDDCTIANNVWDMVGEMRIAGMSQKQLCGDPTVLPAMKLLEMVTVDAARALGLEGVLGSVEKGYKADLVLLDMRKLHTVPNYDLINSIIYSCSGRDVDTVIVDGKVVVEGGKLLTVDEEGLMQEAQGVGEDLLRRALGEEPELGRLLRLGIRL